MHQMPHGTSISTWPAADPISRHGGRTSSTECQSCVRWFTTWAHQPGPLSVYPSQSVTAIAKLNKCNGYLEKMSRASLISSVKSKCQNEQLCCSTNPRVWVHLQITWSLIPGWYTQQRCIITARVHCRASERTEPRRSAVCLFTSQSALPAPHHSQAGLPVPAPAQSHLP